MKKKRKKKKKTSHSKFVDFPRCIDSNGHGEYWLMVIDGRSSQSLFMRSFWWVQAFVREDHRPYEEFFF